jgi:hypothetical protein
MAVSRQSITQGPADEFTTLTCSVTVNSGTNRLMVVSTHCEDADAVISAMTRDGQSFTKLADTQATTWSSVEFWYLVAPNTGTSSVSCTVTGAGAERGRLEVWVFDGARQTSPLRTASESHSDGSNAAQVIVAGVESGDYVIDACASDSTPHAFTAGENQTEDYDNTNGASASFCMYGSHQTNRGGEMSVVWTGASNPYSYLATAVIPDDSPGVAVGYSLFPKEKLRI